MIENYNKSLKIILAEDDDGHAELVKRNLQRSGVINDIHRASNGQDALDMIRGVNVYQEKGPIKNFLMLLDINMPKIDGIQLLKILKSDPLYQACPVIMLTTTDDPREVTKCYELGCSVYVTKPVSADAFIEAIRRLGLFIQVISIPQKRA